MPKKNIKKLNISGSGGGAPDAEDPYIPFEDENTLQSRSHIRFVDLLCEGKIKGLVNDDKSIYINNVQLQSSLDKYAFQGVQTEFKYGSPSGIQTPISLAGFQSSESEKTVNTKVTKLGGGIVRSITSSDVEDIRVTLHIPSLFEQTDLGDIIKTTIAYEIYVQSAGGGYELVHSGTKYGKCVSAYQFSVKIQNISQYGTGTFPYNIKVIRVSEDADSVKKQWDLYWATYTEIINRSLIYPDSALIGITLNSQLFGSQVPSRAYELDGVEILIPTGYTPYNIDTNTAATYPPVWNGTFQTATWCNNPAWVYYDLLTNDRYGLGLDPTLVDKWSLYTIAQYCDEIVDDGYGSVEPRFTFNGVMSSRADAIHAINMIASNFRAMPMWASGYATISQDHPKDPTKLVTNSNVIDGVFAYEGSSLKGRHTVANVSWNDPNDSYKLTVESVEDADGIKRYGYRPIDVVAYGCTSRGQAYRFGKWILETEQNETQIVSYKCGLDQMDVLPGSIVSVADNHYANKRMGGRVVVASTTQITLDVGVVLKPGEIYTISLIKDDGTIQEDLKITNNPDGNEHTVINLKSELASADVPQLDSVWIMTSTNVYPREFRVVRITELEGNTYEINAVFYDANKFARVDEGKTFDPLPYTTVPDTSTPITAPTNPWVEEYSYIDGENSLFGAIFSWTHTTDTRFSHYEVQNKDQSGAYSDIVTTVNNMYDFRPIEGGTYDFRVRARGLGVQSSWLELTGVVIYADPSVPSDITGLKVINGPNNWTFNGKNCEIEWDALELVTGDALPTDSTSALPEHAAELVDNTLTTLKDYQIEVLTTGDVHLRYEWTTDNKFIYTYSMNQLDNGTPIRNIKFELKGRDIYGNLSVTPALIPNGYARNPAPDMRSLTPSVTNVYNGLKIDWSNITPADNDMEKFEVFLDTNTVPTTVVGDHGYNTTVHFEYGLDPDTTYRVFVKPWDVFGVGFRSDIVNGVPLKIAADSIEGELTERLTWTDNDSRTTAQLASLYDHVNASGGVAYDSGDWVSVSFPMESIQDRVSVWANKTFNCYIGYKDQNDTSWNYLKARSTHALYTGGRLAAATDAADAIANYWTASAGAGSINSALFPQGLVAKELGLFILTNTTTIYELVFADQVIAEQIVANNLAAISANLGTVAAGLIQSPNPTDTDGMIINLYEGQEELRLGGVTEPELHWDGQTGALNIRGVVTFRSGTTGIANTDAGALATQDSVAYPDITGTKPPADADRTSINTAAGITGQGNLATQDSVAYPDITGTKPPATATDNSSWTHPSDQTKIDGGDIYAGSSINVSEGGKVVVGSDNIILDGDENAIFVSPDGGRAANDYAVLKDGNLTFFYWDGAQHQTYKSVKRVVSGICNPADGRAYTLPGIWKQTPEIILSYDNIDVYQANRQTQTQTLVLNTGAIIRNGLTWNFHPKAQLVLGPGSGSGGGFGPIVQSSTGNFGQSYTSTPASACLPTAHWIGSSASVVSPTQNSITVTGNTHSYCWSYYGDSKGDQCHWWGVTFNIRLYVNGVHVATSGNLTTKKNTGVAGWSVSYNGSVSSYGIYYNYVGWVGDGYSTQTCPNVGFADRGGKVTTSYITSSSGGISGTTIIANGSLKYIAIGE